MCWQFAIPRSVFGYYENACDMPGSLLPPFCTWESSHTGRTDKPEMSACRELERRAEAEWQTTLPSDDPCFSGNEPNTTDNQTQTELNPRSI